MNSPQTLGQTVVLSLETYFLEIKNQKHFEKLKAYHHFLTSLRFPLRVADPSHSPIERGQRHGTLGKGNGCKWLRERRKDKERIIIREIEKVLAEVRFLTRFVVLNKGGVHG